MKHFLKRHSIIESLANWNIPYDAIQCHPPSTWRHVFLSNRANPGSVLSRVHWAFLCISKPEYKIQNWKFHLAGNYRQSSVYVELRSSCIVTTESEGGLRFEKNLAGRELTQPWATGDKGLGGAGINVGKKIIPLEFWTERRRAGPQSPCTSAFIRRGSPLARGYSSDWEWFPPSHFSYRSSPFPLCTGFYSRSPLTKVSHGNSLLFLRLATGHIRLSGELRK